MIPLYMSGMRTEINKKRRRHSERSEEARAKGAKGAKRGKYSWGVGRIGAPEKSLPGGVWGGAAEKLAFLRFIIVKNAISLQKMQDIPDR